MNLQSQTSSDNILIIPAQRLAHVIRNPHPHVTFNIPKNKAVECLKSGQFLFSRKEICEYGGIPDNSILTNNEQIDLGLANILDLIPPEWMAIQNQDTKYTDTLDKMNNVFGSAFSEEPTEPAIVEVSQLDNKPLETAKDQPVEKPQTPPSSDTPDSLITGGFFGNTSSLFDDEDDEGLDLDLSDDEKEPEEVDIDIQEELEEVDIDIQEELEEVDIDIQEELEEVAINIQEEPKESTSTYSKSLLKKRKNHSLLLIKNLLDLHLEERFLKLKKQVPAQVLHQMVLTSTAVTLEIFVNFTQQEKNWHKQSSVIDKNTVISKELMIYSMFLE